MSVSCSACGNAARMQPRHSGRASSSAKRAGACLLSASKRIAGLSTVKKAFRAQATVASGSRLTLSASEPIRKQSCCWGALSFLGKVRSYSRRQRSCACLATLPWAGSAPAPPATVRLQGERAAACTSHALACLVTGAVQTAGATASAFFPGSRRSTRCVARRTELAGVERGIFSEAGTREAPRGARGRGESPRWRQREGRRGSEAGPAEGAERARTSHGCARGARCSHAHLSLALRQRLTTPRAWCFVVGLPSPGSAEQIEKHRPSSLGDVAAHKEIISTSAPQSKRCGAHNRIGRCRVAQGNRRGAACSCLARSC